MTIDSPRNVSATSTSDRKTIVIFSWFYLPFIGGAELFVKAVTERLSHRYRFIVVTARMDRKLPTEEQLNGVTIRRVGTGFPVDKFIYPVPALMSALMIRPVHLVHSIMVNAAALTAFLYKRFVRRPSLLTLQEGDNEEYVKQWLGPLFPIYPLLHRPFDRIHSISSFLEQQAVGYGAARNSITVVPNGVDTNRFSAGAWPRDELESLRRRLDLAGKRVVISISRLVSKNGLQDLIRAMPAVVRRHPDAVLLLVGDGPERSLLERSAKQLGIGHQVLFAGAVIHEETARHLLLAEVFARPSISEGLGSAFLEAMSCGVPVVGTPVGGIVDFLRDGETGLVCKPGDPDSVSECICRLLENEELARHVSRQGRRQVERDYRWDSVAERIGELYDELLEREFDLTASFRESRSRGKS